MNYSTAKCSFSLGFFIKIIIKNDSYDRYQVDVSSRGIFHGFYREVH